MDGGCWGVGSGGTRSSSSASSSGALLLPLACRFPMLTVAPQGVEVLLLLGLYCCTACRHKQAAGAGGGCSGGCSSRYSTLAEGHLKRVSVVQMLRQSSAAQTSPTCAAAAAPLAGSSDAIATLVVIP